MGEVALYSEKPSSPVGPCVSLFQPVQGGAPRVCTHTAKVTQSNHRPLFDPNPLLRIDQGFCLPHLPSCSKAGPGVSARAFYRVPLRPDTKPGDDVYGPAVGSAVVWYRGTEVPRS